MTGCLQQPARARWLRSYVSSQPGCRRLLRRWGGHLRGKGWRGGPQRGVRYGDRPWRGDWDLHRAQGNSFRRGRVSGDAVPVA